MSGSGGRGRLQGSRGNLTKYGRKTQEVPEPPWRAWRGNTQTSTRATRWIRDYVRIPTGHNQGDPMVLAPYQRTIVREVYDRDNRMVIVSIPAANAKTTTLAAMALERLTRGDMYAEVVVFATKQEQAQWLVNTAKMMVETSVTLEPLFQWWAAEAILEYLPTGSKLHAHPAKLHYAQGLNFNLAIVDEIGFCQDNIVQALIARVSKRPDSIVVGVGTPGFEPNVMYRLREQHEAGALPPGVTYLEWAAPYGCNVNDPKAWEAANPGMAAGIVTRQALATQVAIMPERDFRVYHLGQWVQQAVLQWLPDGAWEDQPHADPPEDGAEVVVAVDGTYMRTTAVVGAVVGTGQVFHLWAAERATDAEVRKVLMTALERWNVRLLTHFGRVRVELMREVANTGMAVVEPFNERHAEAVTATNEFYRAIVERRVAHDHHKLITQHMTNVTSRPTADGIVLQRVAAEGRWIDAAMAARTAWWRAIQINPVGDLRIM